MSSKQRPLRLLALDGGGVRGLSSLIILKRIMYILGRRQGLPGQQLLRPCDHFDMIAGTSTGGLIAIMLGTFSMGVQECIDAYLDMAPKIFPKEDFVSGSALGKAWKGVRGTARFDAAALEAEVKKLIVEHLKEEPNVVFDQISKSEDDCHVVVCSSYGHVNQPSSLRSYPSNLEDSTECTVWQAVRATSAAPLFFDPITFGKPPRTYVDGALHNNNPVRVLLDEVKSVWGPASGRCIGCIVSIGTGTPPLSPLGEGAIEIVRSLAKMVTDTERTAREFKNEIYHLPLAERPAYFRFNVQRGLGDIGLEEWEHFNTLTEATSAYLDGLREEIDCCVTALLPTPDQIRERSYSVLSSTIPQKRKHDEEHSDELPTEIEPGREKSKRERQDPDSFKCLEIFRTSEYESHKERNPDRVIGTCHWVLQHERFQTWQQSEVPSLLWVSADPGCGKSVLSKSLVDTELCSTESRTTCYFFFKDDNIDQKGVTKALCALLHQLFSKNHSLIEHALHDFRQEGSSLPQLFYSLWRILIKATTDPRAGEVICILDALDECEESGRYQLIDSLNKYFTNATSCERQRSTLKFLVTSRPYFDIERRFKRLTHNFPTIRLEGEKESEAISREITSVIKVRVQQIGLEVRLDHEEMFILERELLKARHRTYLWLKLIFDEIRSSLSVTKIKLRNIVTTLPGTVEKAYEAILAKSTNVQQARKLLCIVVAAVRPLTLREMNIALNIEEGCKSYDELDLEKEQNFETVVKNLCGLFVSVIDDRIYLIHQTAKEFLIAKNGDASSGWKHSIQPTEPELVFTIVCVNYLQFSVFEDNSLMAEEDKVDEEELPEERWSVEAVAGPDSRYLLHHKAFSYSEKHDFLEYAATNWIAHFRKAQPKIELPTMELVLQICNPQTKRYQTWFRVYWAFQHLLQDCPDHFNVLTVASYFGLEAVIKHLLEKGDNPDQKDSMGRTPLSWAVEGWQETVVELFLARDDVDVNSRDWRGRTPLIHVAESKKGSVSRDDTGVNEREVTKETILMLLLSRDDIRVNLTDLHGRTLLLVAVEHREMEIVKLLISRGDIDVNARDDRYRTPLSVAAELVEETIVKLLFSRNDLDVNPRNRDGRTPLSIAAEHGHEVIVKILLSRGAKLHSTDTNGWTALIWAAIHGREEIIQLLVDRGADTKGQNLNQALLQATELGVKWLLKFGGKVTAVDEDGCTALHLASYKGHEKTIAQLLQHGASMAAQNAIGETPLHGAIMWRRFGAARILVSAGSPLGICDIEGKAPLMYAELFMRNDKSGFVSWLRSQL